MKCRKPETSAPIPMWGGIECTVNRVGERFQDQFEANGHPSRLSDFDRIAALGIRALRTPVLWERIAPDSPDEHEWSYADAALTRLAELNIEPIVGLLHHGSGPRYTNLLDERFPEKFAQYARLVAERYPHIRDYTPVNEILTTARFSALYGHWYPHAKDEASFGTALTNEVRATVLAMREIRRINPQARLIQTDDLGKIHSTTLLQYQADFENERRWLGWDLLCGRVDPTTWMWKYLRNAGVPEHRLYWHLENQCPPDVLGVNYYISSERFLDHRLELHPSEAHGGNGRHRYVDVLAARLRVEGVEGMEGVLRDAWDRYRIPLAVTECHMGCTREEQMRWLIDCWQGAHVVRDEGAEIEGFTVWSMMGAFDWNCLLTDWRGCYEPGVFDLRAPEPRPTALASVVSSLAQGEIPSHPAVQGDGWWQRDIRHTCEPVATAHGRAPHTKRKAAPPILITGARGTLAGAFERLCQLRGLEYRLLSREDLDITDPKSMARLLRETRAWAVINAAGFVNVDEAQQEMGRCFRENTAGPAVLAGVCSRLGVRLVTFSSDQVFDGTKGSPYHEQDATHPLNVYGRSKVEAERCVLTTLEDALVVRTSALFGPWDTHSFAYRALTALASGKPFDAPDREVVSPTYVPDLVQATLDLLIDGERGIWHLANRGATTWFEFAREVACRAGIDISLLRRSESMGPAPRPANSALASSRGWVMPTLDEGLDRFVEELAGKLQALSSFRWG